MKVITILNDRREILARKIQDLETELMKLDGIATDRNMTSVAERMHVLETELKVAKMALANLDKELMEKNAFTSTEEYKKLLKRKDEIKAENLKRTKKIYQDIIRIHEEALAILEKNKEYDRLCRSTGTFIGMTANMAQPYNWLWQVEEDTRMRMENANGLTKYLE